MKFILGLIAVVAFVGCVHGHGKMTKPVNRATLWRVDPSSPPDYNDNQCFCGGQSVQHNVNGGKCGTCGDDWRDSVPREHEHGGKYGEGKIVATYDEGSVISVTALLTANHKGLFVFSLCDMTGKERETEECYRNVTLANGEEVFKVTTTGPGSFDIDLKLPAGLTCKHCVLRWHYHCGNTWGMCEDGTGKPGCGPQETFRSCADVTINPKRTYDFDYNHI